MAKHSIETLTKDVDSFKRSTNSRFSAITQTLNDIQPKVQEMHDFIVDYRGFERGKGNNGNVSISKDAWALIVKLVIIIGAILGINHLQ